MVQAAIGANGISVMLADGIQVTDSVRHTVGNGIQT